MLKVDNIDVYYGAIHAIKGVSIQVGKGEIVTLVGSNGAGKSTTLRTISGLLKPRTSVADGIISLSPLQTAAALRTLPLLNWA